MSANDAVVARLRSELAAVRPDLDIDSIPSDAHLKLDLAIDSLDVLEFVARVEAAFRIIIPDEDWQNVASLDSLAEYLMARGEVTLGWRPAS
jgi:acyl carrier protein